MQGTRCAESVRPSVPLLTSSVGRLTGSAGRAAGNYHVSVAEISWLREYTGYFTVNNYFDKLQTLPNLFFFRFSYIIIVDPL